MFTARIQTDNAAFEEDDSLEVRERLRDIIEAMMTGQRRGFVRDTNGNRIGEWSLTKRNPGRRRP